MVLWIMRVVKENLFWVLENRRSLPSAETVPLPKHHESFDRLWGKLSQCPKASCSTALGLGCAAAGRRACWQLYYKARPTWAAVQKALQVAWPCSRWHCAAIPACSRATNVWVCVHSSENLSEVRVWIISRLFQERLVGLLKSSIYLKVYVIAIERRSARIGVFTVYTSPQATSPVYHTSSLQTGLQFSTAPAGNPAYFEKKKKGKGRHLRICDRAWMHDGQTSQKSLLVLGASAPSDRNEPGCQRAACPYCPDEPQALHTQPCSSLDSSIHWQAGSRGLCSSARWLWSSYPCVHKTTLVWTLSLRNSLTAEGQWVCVTAQWFPLQLASQWPPTFPGSTDTPVRN